MTILPILKISMSDKNYYQIATNIFQKYTNNNLEGKPC